MRLGGFYSAERVEELEPLCAALDRHGLSAIQAPNRLASMSDDECVEFGEAARRLGLVVGETGMWDNLLARDPAVQAERIERVRVLLRKSELLGCRCVITLVGSTHPSDNFLAPHPGTMSRDGAAAFREVVLWILDGLELQTARYGIEPWVTTFFYELEDIEAFLADVDHPALGLHLDLVNMVSRRTYFDTAGLAERTFASLSDRIVGAHLKDLVWDPAHMIIKWDEVLIGDGAMDYSAYLGGLSRLDPDLACYCEHLPTEAEYAENFARVHAAAERSGLRFLPRTTKENEP